MKKAGLVPKDIALIFGKWQELQTTSVGHYALYIVPMEGRPENCLLTQIYIQCKTCRLFSNPTSSSSEPSLSLRVWRGAHSRPQGDQSEKLQLHLSYD